jgi:hypothetical protein
VSVHGFGVSMIIDLVNKTCDPDAREGPRPSFRIRRQRAGASDVILVPHAQAALTGHPRAGGKMIEVAKVRITAAGPDALAAEGW